MLTRPEELTINAVCKSQRHIAHHPVAFIFCGEALKECINSDTGHNQRKLLRRVETDVKISCMLHRARVMPA